MKSAKLLVGIAVGAALTFLPMGCRPKQPGTGPSSKVVEAMNRGVSLMGQYNYEGAANAFAEALRAAPELTDAKINLAIARFNRAQKEQQDIEQAGALLDAVLQTEPANTRAWYFKGIVLQHQGQAEAAINCFERVVQQRPDDGVAWYLLGMCKQRLGQNAEKELLRAIELRPYLASAYYKLWQVLQAAGQPEQAAPYLDKFKQLRENPLAETIELPQYNQMGDLALVRPLPARNTPPITKSSITPQSPRALFTSDDTLLYRARSLPRGNAAAGTPTMQFGGFTAGDLNGDGRLDLIVTAQGKDGQGRLVLLLGEANGGYADATTGSGLEKVRGPMVCALGDYDNDEILDLFVACVGTNYLFRGKGDGTFTDVTTQSGICGSGTVPRSAVFLDADHDGDLDLFVCNAAPAGNQLWNNNADGTFTNIAATAGVLCGDATTVAVLPGDLDGDRHMDLVLLLEGQPAKVFVNDLLGKYHEADPGVEIRGDLGGVLQDFNGDGHLDVLALGGNPPELHLYLGDGHGRFHHDEAFAQCAKAAASWGELRGFRAVDLDLDGDLDIVLFGKDAHVLFNDGTGKFVFQAAVWPSAGGVELAGAELFDLNGDFVPDLLRVERGPTNRLVLVPSTLTPPSTALSVAPTGMRGRDKRTRSPASGYGASLTLRAGLHEQRLVYTGLAGGFNQSRLPVVFGLGGARQADYLQLLWPDGVAQVEIALNAGQSHKIAELQRKLSSCPVLFAWNGTRFDFVTDFAGVGGLGYFVAPGQYAQPQVLEHVKIEPERLRPRDGFYELRITEPMEETAYVDQLELLVIDHPADWQVFPDERLAVSGPPPTHELLVVDKPIFPTRAVDPMGRDCTEQLTRVDRIYAYEPELDRRFFGFCRPHTLELDFGDQLASVPANQRLFLFISGYLEYPYSQTAYAASQAHVGWEPIRIERLTPDGQWETLIPDAGAFGGMARTMTVDLTRLADGPNCRLRLTSNLEIYYDRIFLARDVGGDRVNIHALPVAEAELRRVGFAREFSPDGRMPLIYDYELSDSTAPFHVLRGAYTRYGPVKELLQEFDDQYVLVGPGDEIAVKFDGSKLPALAPGTKRSFVLVSHAYCKDMDLYTATPQTLEPLPFRGMSRYPYPATERYPNTKEHRQFQATYNTRIVE
jgi:Flp pilus assembly protein TadD